MGKKKGKGTKNRGNKLNTNSKIVDFKSTILMIT